jgi:hypothetical protein
MQCVTCRPSAFSRLQPLQTRAPQQHNRIVLAFAEFRAKAAGGVGLTCRVVSLVPAFGIAATGRSVATFAVPPASPPDEVRRALSASIIRLDRFRPRAAASVPFPTFASLCSTHFCERAPTSRFRRVSGARTSKSGRAGRSLRSPARLRKQRDTSNSMILVWLCIY